METIKLFPKYGRGIMSSKKNVESESRRDFVKKSGLLVGGIVGGGVLGGLLGPKVFDNTSDTASTTVTEGPAYNEALMYFTNMEDFNVLKALTERIFPEDENGPGAIALAVPFYIDHQLAGLWGNNSREYMQGPFYEGEPTQGFQTHLKRNEIFSLGIKAVREYSLKTFDEEFVKLEGEQQDDVLIALENGEIDLPSVSSSYFFSLLRSATLEGVYADPLYGGNKNMEGWKMKQYPGDQMTYKDVIESEEFVEIEPSSLRDHHN